MGAVIQKDEEKQENMGSSIQGFVRRGDLPSDPATVPRLNSTSLSRVYTETCTKLPEPADIPTPNINTSSTNISRECESGV